MGYDGEGVEEALRTADVLFGWSIPRDDLARRAPRLRWFHAHGAGVNHLMPLDWLPQGAVLTNSRGVHGERATEYAAMALLMLNNRVPEMVSAQREGRWGKFFNSHIGGKTLVIHRGRPPSAGRSRSGQGARASGCSGCAGPPRPHRYVDEMHGPDAVPALMDRADFVMVSAPCTHESRHLIGREELARLRPGAGLLNYSRAGVVDYEALREKLERREMSAVLDVFDPEPLPESSPLWQTPNLIITPHCSSDDSDYYTPRTLDLVMENSGEIHRREAAAQPGEPPPGVLSASFGRRPLTPAPSRGEARRAWRGSLPGSSGARTRIRWRPGARCGSVCRSAASSYPFGPGAGVRAAPRSTP